MTTYHTDPCAGLSAPSDAELTSLDRAHNAMDGKLNFNQFTRLIGLTYSRARFHRYIDGAGLAGTRQATKEWWTWYGRMLKDADAKDQHDTQNDALI